MLHTDTCKSQATNRRSCHASHRYQQIPDNKSHFLPCLTQIPANHRQQIILLVMPHTDTSKSQAILPTTVHLTMPHTDTSKSQATNRTSYHASHRYQQTTGNKTYILPCLTHIPGNHRQHNVHLTMLHTDTSKSQATNQVPANHRQQIVHRTCIAQMPANHRQQIVHLIMPPTDTSKSQARKRISCHASHGHQKITGNKSYILPCFTQIPANHRPSCQQIVHLAMPHTDTRKSQAILPTNRTSYHALHRHQQITGNKSYILPSLTQIPANHRQEIVHRTMPHTDTSKSQATNPSSCHASHR